MLLFTEASMKQLSVIKNCLDRFCEHLGQKVSVAKIKIFFSSNMDNCLAKRISEKSGFSKCNNLSKYGEFPSFIVKLLSQPIATS